MKKIVGVLSFLSIFMISFVSAGPVEGVRQLLEGLRDILYIIVQFLFDISGDLGIYDEYIFAKLILLFIIYIVVYTVIKKSIFKDYVEEGKPKPILYIISAAIAILSIRYLPDEMIEAILLPYSALGVGLTVFLPLFIYFYFLQTSGLGFFGREVGWVIFGSTFIALWSTRYENLGDANFIYWIGILFIIICFIFDKRIHNYFGMKEYHIARKEYFSTLWADYQEKINAIDIKLKDLTLPDSVRKSLERTKEKHLREQARIAKKIR